MKETKKTNILFINDGSILNPIIHSQGLPLLKFLSNSYNCTMLSFELPVKSDKEHERYNYIHKNYKSYVSFVQTELKNYGVVPYLIIYFLKGIPKTFFTVKKYKIKLIHTRSLFPAIIGLCIKIIFPKTKLLYDNRGVLIEEMIYTGIYKRAGFREKIMRRLENRVIRKSDHIVVVSKVFKDFLINKYSHLENLSDKISVINNKTEIDNKITPEDLDLRKDKNIITCIYSGSSAQWQSVQEIFTFAQKCLSEFKDFKLKILTYHPEEFQNQFLHFNDLSEITEILNVSSDKVFNHLAKANYGLLLREDNIINNVSSPLKFAEYLAAGLPVVVSKGVGDTGEIIDKYNVGVVIKNNDFQTAILELKELLKDSSVYKRCREVAVKEFNLEKSFKDYKLIYDNLIFSSY